MVIETKIYRFQEGQLVEIEHKNLQYDPSYSYLVITTVNGIPVNSKLITG